MTSPRPTAPRRRLSLAPGIFASGMRVVASFEAAKGMLVLLAGFGLAYALWRRRRETVPAQRS